MAGLNFSISIENFNPGGRSCIFSIFGPLGFSNRTQRTLPYCFQHGVRFRSVLLLCSEFTTHSASLLKIEQITTENVVIHYIFSSESLRVVNSLQTLSQGFLEFGKREKSLFFGWFSLLFPKKKRKGTERTAVVAIQLRMRMRILTRPENSLVNFNHQITNKKLRIKRCEGIR